ncbi:PAS domain-containing protein [Tunicatimonas pelagia]|uniref:PAS domain-containing protein n=1 Tax=Tunicatimonas pelagia TaxID=931531 RepID=UPI00266691C0|nr:PAS domain-containing protein [Tunicatimonas pelagia]WKN43375.1 PAS domain-containing protein [Tunicatimonas pelagia]
MDSDVTLTSDQLAVFETLPESYLVLSPAFSILTASNTYLAATGTLREEIVGKQPKDIFSDVAPMYVVGLHSSLQEVLDTGNPHQIKLIGTHRGGDKNEQPLLSGEDNWENYTELLNTPVFYEQGNVRYIIHEIKGVSPVNLLAHTFANDANEKGLLSVLFEQSMMAVALYVGREYRIDIANTTFCKVLGRTPEQALGTPLFELLPELVGQGYKELLDGVLTTGVPCTVYEQYSQINRYGRKDTAYWDLEYYPSRDDEGNVVGVGVVAMEVTKRVEARQQLEAKNNELKQALRKAHELTALLDNSNDFVGLATPEGQGIYINPAGRAMTGISASRSAAEIKIEDFIYKEDVPFLQDTIIPAQFKKGSWSGDFRFRHFKTNQRIDVFYNCFTVNDPETNEVLALATISQDISERKKREAELENYREQLYHTNQELASLNEELMVVNEDLGQTNEHLRSVNADLDNFVYMASHDLKAPIINIQRLLEILKDHLPPENQQSVEMQKSLTMIDKSVARFKDTLADLSDLTRLQRQANLPEELVSVAEVIESVRLDMAMTIKEANARLDIQLIDCSPVYFAPKNLRSVVYNLLSNALKYRNPQRDPIIQIRCEEVDGYQLLTVKDNGLGMNLNQSDKLFSMFHRFHSHVEGTGIGLYMVKKIVENAGGKIEVESAVGIGTMFQVYLKASKAMVESV